MLANLSSNRSNPSHLSNTHPEKRGRGCRWGDPESPFMWRSQVVTRWRKGLGQSRGRRMTHGRTHDRGALEGEIDSGYYTPLGDMLRVGWAVLASGSATRDSWGELSRLHCGRVA